MSTSSGCGYGWVRPDLFVAHAPAREEARTIQLGEPEQRSLLESYSGLDAENESVADAIEAIRLDHVLKVGPKV